VALTVPLKVSTPDILVADSVVKVNMAPYLLLLDLYGEIDVSGAVATVNHETKKIHIELPKVVEGEWPQISAVGISKNALQERREASLARKAILDENIRQKIKDAKSERKTAEVRVQMEVDRKQREALESRQAEEKAKAQAAVFETFKALSMEASGEVGSLQDTASTAPLPVKTRRGDAGAVKHPRPTTTASSGSSNEGKVLAAVVSDPLYPPPAPFLAAAGCASINLGEEVVDCIPPPRAPQKPSLTVSFTPRVFPSPMRESRAREEEDWLARNYSKLRENQRAGLASGNLSFVEKDAAWLKGKGDEFVRLGDWDSACSAYTSAITATSPDTTTTTSSSSMRATLLLNRAACHLRKLRSEACLRDCESALGIALAGEGGVACPPDAIVSRMTAAFFHPENGVAGLEGPPTTTTSTRTFCAKAVSRRMAALCQLCRYREALGDCALAATLCACEAERVYFSAATLRLESLGSCEELKIKGDGRARAGDVEGALDSYATALEKEPEYALCRLNRSALLFGAGRWVECVADCEKILRSMPEEGRDESDPVSPFPPPGGDLSAQIRVRALKRREEALKNTQTTTALCTTNE